MGQKMKSSTKIILLFTRGAAKHQKKSWVWGFFESLLKVEKLYIVWSLQVHMPKLNITDKKGMPETHVHDLRVHAQELI